MSDAPLPSAPDRRPAVARVISDRGVWIFAVALVLGGGILFGALESRRAGLTAPAIAPEPDSVGSVLASPPELALPSSWQTPPPALVPAPIPLAPPPAPVAQPSHYAREAPQYVPPPVAIATPTPVAPVKAHETSEVVFHGQATAPVPNQGKKEEAAPGKAERVEATRFANPATTVPKGTVLQAVLESALDSTRAGMARAIISRDIYGFDGTKILIPRGSRLIGEYKSDVQHGQNRALIEWQRLMRPDGVLINLDSPSADPLGRAGIKGKVNNHFLSRYGSAIMQSALEVGEQVAINRLSPNTTIYESPLYALQNSTQNSGSSSSSVQPTVTVRQGTSLSVFVARDLDFTSVEP